MKDEFGFEIESSSGVGTLELQEAGPLFGQEAWETTIACPEPTRQVVSGFPRYRFSVAALPRSEQQKVRDIARLIVRSFQPGCQPLLSVRLIGHADSDPARERREPGFVIRISLRRALAVQQTLQALINNRSITSRIDWNPRGLGSTRLVVPNPTTEQERMRNRRVEVFVLRRQAPPPPPPQRQLVTRKRSSAMTRDEQNRFIRVMQTLISASGNPFGRLAGNHSNPLHNMHSMAGEVGVQRFLAWHRLYLMRLEEMMRRVDSQVFIPYWDWTTERNVPAWIVNLRPTVAFLTEDGRSFSQPVQRNPPGRGETLPTIAEINSILANQTYRSFTSDLEDGPHNTVHRWVNGTMSSIPIAAADPLFWLHHAQIDRIWSIWQASPRGRGQGPSLTGRAAILDPWPETVAQVASVTALGYTYGP